MQDELDTFVASLRIPAERKVVIHAELADHVACAVEAAQREGRDVVAARREALANLEALRRSLEAVEPAFAITRSFAIVRGIAAGVLVAIVLDQGGPAMRGLVGALIAIAIGLTCAPSRSLSLLRAELRARRVRGVFGRGDIAIGPAFGYALAVSWTPFVVWVGLIVARAIGGVTTVDVPWSAFALAATIHAILAVEAVRARGQAIA